MTGLDEDEDEITELKTQFKDENEERRTNMSGCACCSVMSAEEMLADKGGEQGGGSCPIRGDR